MKFTLSQTFLPLNSRYEFGKLQSQYYCEHHGEFDDLQCEVGELHGELQDETGEFDGEVGELQDEVGELHGEVDELITTELRVL